MGVVVRRYIDILTIIINFPYSTCISSFFGSSIPNILCSFLKCFFGLYIVHPENFRSNAQNAIAFACRNRPRVNCSDHLHAFAFASTVCDRVRAIARTCVRSHLRACEVHLIKDHQIKLRAHAHVYTRTCTYIYNSPMARHHHPSLPLPLMVWFSLI